ncbi:hypothetical protein EG68_07164 [Paragonimus skrjabini miyazakii]|uniref:Uncharacterized protein n=1 Tax=Paragonimus skrjabini miyazakii TaxID=59628 RepID=A0A8S9YRT1_9TREM|nr:hypothetical protein EG68_07164 [Paragonimus skrjabini miyazakii]
MYLPFFQTLSKQQQSRLVERLGETAIPFRFTLRHDIPASITIQSEHGFMSEEHPCGIEYTLQVIQVTEMTIFKQHVTRTVVSEMESDDGFPVNPNSRDWEHRFTIRPSLQDALQKAGLALDGKLKHEDTTLASSTLIKDFRKKDMMALVIQYLIRVKVFTGFGGRDVEADIPVILTHKRGTQEIVKAETVGDLIIEKFKRNKSKLVDLDEDV